MNLAILHGRVKKIYPSRATKNGYEYFYFSLEVKKSFRSREGENKTYTTEILCCKFGEPPVVSVDDMVIVKGELSSRKEENTHKTSVTINELTVTSSMPVSHETHPQFHQEDVPF